MDKYGSGVFGYLYADNVIKQYFISWKRHSGRPGRQLARAGQGYGSAHWLYSLYPVHEPASQAAGAAVSCCVCAVPAAGICVCVVQRAEGRISQNSIPGYLD